MLETSNTLNTVKIKLYCNKVKVKIMSNQQETKLCNCLAAMRVGYSETTQEGAFSK